VYFEHIKAFHYYPVGIKDDVAGADKELGVFQQHGFFFDDQPVHLVDGQEYHERTKNDGVGWAESEKFREDYLFDYPHAGKQCECGRKLLWIFFKCFPFSELPKPQRSFREAKNIHVYRIADVVMNQNAADHFIK
jgi:hypothetical protein